MLIIKSNCKCYLSTLELFLLVWMLPLMRLRHIFEETNASIQGEKIFKQEGIGLSMSSSPLISYVPSTSKEPLNSSSFQEKEPLDSASSREK